MDAFLDANPGLKTLAVFAPLPGEVDLFPCMIRRPDLCWVFPRVSGEALSFHAASPPEFPELAAGAFGIREPEAGLVEISVKAIDAFFCPGLAFDSCGGRLGRGRGFYDRVLLIARPDALKIGVCFPEQLVATTHPEPHDVPMDQVIC